MRIICNKYLLLLIKKCLTLEKALTNRLEQKFFPDQQSLSFYQRLPKESFPDIIENDLSPPFFVHIHLPKTGGSTFNIVLKKNFRRDGQRPHGIPEGFEQFAGRYIFLFDKFSNQQVKQFIDVHTTINCVASHNFSAILPYQNASRKIIAIAFLRDPVDTFFSLYFHLRFFGGNFIEAQKNIDEYIDFRISHLKPAQKMEGFLALLAGEESEDAFHYIKALVENGHLHLFDTYRMKEACGILNKLFPDYFTDLDFTIENVSKKDQAVSEDQRSRIRQKVSCYDFKLLDLARTHVEKFL